MLRWWWLDSTGVALKLISVVFISNYFLNLTRERLHVTISPGLNLFNDPFLGGSPIASDGSTTDVLKMFVRITSTSVQVFFRRLVPSCVGRLSLFISVDMKRPSAAFLRSSKVLNEQCCQ
jgi:hypothetical protein